MSIAMAIAIVTVVGLLGAIILVLAAITAVGVFVYRDAKARGLSAAAWTICAVLLPVLSHASAEMDARIKA